MSTRYAVMSNHLHVVLAIEPTAANARSDQEIAERWVRLFPAREPEQNAAKAKALSEDRNALGIRRKRLCDLSWYMRCLDEHIARKANAEDDVTGRFWEGRFKCQLLDDEAALAAAMAYVDLNPVRAGIADSIETSDHTSVQARAKALRDDRSLADAPLRPIVGVGISVFTGEAFVSRLAISNRQYIEPVDFTGRQLKPGKRGKIDARRPSALSKLGLQADQWTGHVKGIGSGYSRMVGSIEALQAKAAEWQQR
jgi:REP element-mobilizing transposase RayT